MNNSTNNQTVVPEGAVSMPCSANRPTIAPSQNSLDSLKGSGGDSLSFIREIYQTPLLSDYMKILEEEELHFRLAGGTSHASDPLRAILQRWIQAGRPEVAWPKTDGEGDS